MFVDNKYASIIFYQEYLWSTRESGNVNAENELMIVPLCRKAMNNSYTCGYAAQLYNLISKSNKSGGKIKQQCLLFFVPAPECRDFVLVLVRRRCRRPH